MEKVNIRFHDNGTVSYQHKKILKFVPELSIDQHRKITVPNIPLLVSIFFCSIVQKRLYLVIYLIHMRYIKMYTGISSQF